MPLLSLVRTKGRCYAKTLHLKSIDLSGQGGHNQRSRAAHDQTAWAPLKPDWQTFLASYKELSDFLEGAERRAFKQAVFAVKNDSDALDLVQDAMIRLTEKYGDRPAEELPMLFQRILQNAIRDHFRRTKVRSTWMTLISSLTPDNDDPYGFLETCVVEGPAGSSPNPEQHFSQTETIALIEDQLKKLPPRQREAFVMRYWLEMDVAETAAAMGCTEGSVKTHCSRATHTLASALNIKGIYP